MTQNELLYILTIAEHRSITGAAQELFISQPSLSESLNKVEQKFGKTIFDRTQDGLVPTAFGLHYLRVPQERSSTAANAWRSIWTNTVSCAAESSPSAFP